MASVAVKIDGVGGGEDHLRHEQFGGLVVIAADLIYAEGDGLVLSGVLALDDQHRDAVDKKDHVLAVAMSAVVEGKLLGDLEDVGVDVFVVNQPQVQFAVFLRAKERGLIAEIVQEISVAEDVGWTLPQPPSQRALGLAVLGVELAYLGKKQVVEIQRRILCVGSESPPLLRLSPWHKGPADFLGIGQNAGLNGFMFGRFHFLSSFWSFERISTLSARRFAYSTAGIRTQLAVNWNIHNTEKTRLNTPAKIRVSSY